MKRGVKRALHAILIFFLVILIAIIILFITRLITNTEIDDVSPGIPCPEIQQYNPDVLYVIPNYKNIPISENREWCNYILSLNKELALHGITHEYREFLYNNISQEELNYGILEFKKCFGHEPEIFKPSQLAISKENKQLIKKNNLKLKGYFHQVIHKVYHCSDDKQIPNRIIKIF